MPAERAQTIWNVVYRMAANIIDEILLKAHIRLDIGKAYIYLTKLDNLTGVIDSYYQGESAQGLIQLNAVYQQKLEHKTAFNCSFLYVS